MCTDQLKDWQDHGSFCTTLIAVAAWTHDQLLSDVVPNLAHHGHLLRAGGATQKLTAACNGFHDGWICVT